MNDEDSPRLAPDALVAIIGLGAMGLPMAIRLRHAGFAVRGFDVDARARARFSTAGGEVADTPANAAREAMLCLVMVHDGTQADAALFGGEAGPDCVATALAPNAVVWMASTVSAEDAVLREQRLTEHGVRMLDGPVSGGVNGAQQGTLSLMVGGAADTLAYAMPALQACAARVVHVGSTGSGASVKMINNMLAASHVALTAEALALGARVGIAADTLIDVIAQASGSSRMFLSRARRMAAGEHEPQATVQIFLKDLDIAHASAQQFRQPTPVSSAVRHVFNLAAQSGLSDQSDTRLRDLYDTLQQDLGEQGTEWPHSKSD